MIGQIGPADIDATNGPTQRGGHLKIVHVVFRCIPDNYRGGVERVAFELASAQAALGHEVEVLAVRQEDEHDQITGQGLRLRYFPGKRIGGVLSSPELIAALRRDAATIDVIHAHNTFHPLNIAARRFARQHGIAFYVHPHGALDPKLFDGFDLRSLKKKLYIALFERPNLQAANAVFALSEKERSQLRELGVSTPIEVTPNGIVPPTCGSSAQRAELRARLGIAEDAPVILYLGRVVPKKAIEDIIQALVLVRQTHPAAQVLLVGDPEEDPGYSAALRDLALREGVSGAIHWLGFATEQGKAESLAAADMFIHASHSEGQAMAVLEGMSVGLATVLTEGCYMSEAALEGALVETEQGPVALAAGLLRLIDQPELMARIAASGREYVTRNHGWPTLARRIIGQYKRHAPRLDDSAVADTRSI